MLFRQILSEKILLEDFGNLKGIDKRILLRLFSSDFNGYSDKSIGTPLGRNSKVEEHSVSSKFSEYLKMIFNQVIRGFVITIDDHPILAISYGTEEVGSKYRSYRQFSKTKVKAMTINNGPGVRLDFGDVSLESKFLRGDYSDAFIITRKTADVLFEGVKKKALADQSVLRIIFLYSDETRSKLRIDRKQSRKGMVPTDEDARRAYEKELRIDLKSRLNQFKNSKSPAFATLEEMFNAVRTSGAFQKVRYMGVTYNRDGEEGSITDLIDFQQGKKWSGGWAIRYHYDWNDPGLDQHRDTRRERTAELWNEKIGRLPSYDEKHSEELKYMNEEIENQVNQEFPRPPDYIYISYRPEGGSIVPDKIDSKRPF